tara:strand:+ start:73 stop:492 length:420 start_codon:yes stop_codon:yes gene_type:complete
MVNKNKIKEAEIGDFFNDRINSQESVLGIWLTVTATLTATGILFYNMSFNTNPYMSKSLAGLLSSGIVISAMFYNLFSLYNFIKRNAFLIEYQEDHFFKREVLYSQIFYSIFTCIIATVQIIIVYVILKNELPKILARW